MSLGKLERFVDVLINKRLYAACYKDLNDPFEGCFDWESLEEKEKNEFKSTMYNARICSLQTAKEGDVPSDVLMWSHYADSHKGCCLKVSIDCPKDWYGGKIIYNEDLPIINWKNVEDNVESIFFSKKKEWEREKEYRFVRFYKKEPKKDVYIKVKLEAVYLGCKTLKKDVVLLSKLVQKVSPDVAVYKMKKKSDRDFYSDLESELISK